MSLGCASCGDCCDPVWIDEASVEKFQSWITYYRNGGTRAMPGRDPLTGRFAQVDPTVRFIGEHMTEIGRRDGSVSFACEFFDGDTRLCTAYDQRPPMCSNYPWYGQNPSEVLTKEPGRLPSRCSLALDVPPDVRLPDARPLIPLTVLRRAS